MQDLKSLKRCEANGELQAQRKQHQADSMLMIDLEQFDNTAQFYNYIKYSEDELVGLTSAVLALVGTMILEAGSLLLLFCRRTPKDASCADIIKKLGNSR